MSSTPRLPPLKLGAKAGGNKMAPRPPPGSSRRAGGSKTDRGGRPTAKTMTSVPIPPMSARGADDKSASDRRDSLRPQEGAPAVRMPPEQRKLVGSMSTDQLRVATGRAPVPWWWSRPAGGSGSGEPGRAPTPHEAYAAVAMDPHASSRAVYVHWLYAQFVGYQAFSIPIGKHGQLALTTPTPVQGMNVKPMITARGLEPAVQRELFAEFLAGAGALPPLLVSLLPSPKLFPRGLPPRRHARFVCNQIAVSDHRPGRHEGEGGHREPQQGPEAAGGQGGRREGLRGRGGR
jgi:hypothetical protein